MPFPSAVNVVPAPAVEGDFATTNPRFSVSGTSPGEFTAGASGCYVGRFAWIDATGQLLNNTGAGPVTGFVSRRQDGIITTYLQEASLLIPSGLPVIAYSGGDFWIRNTGASAVTVGMKAYANNATGLATFAATGSPPTGGSVTASLVANSFTGSVAANSCTAAISGNIMTVSAIVAGTVIAAGQSVSGTGVPTGMTVLSYVAASGTQGGVGQYVVSISATVASTAITLSGGGLTITAVGANCIVAVGQTITGGTIAAGTVINGLGTGTGGTGTYAVSTSTASSSGTITVSNGYGAGVLVVTAVASGTVLVNDTISGGTIAAGTVINAYNSGTGGTGSYLVSTNTASSSGTVTVLAATETKWIAMSAGAAGELIKISDHPLG